MSNHVVACGREVIQRGRWIVCLSLLMLIGCVSQPSTTPPADKTAVDTGTPEKTVSEFYQWYGAEIQAMSLTKKEHPLAAQRDKFRQYLTDAFFKSVTEFYDGPDYDADSFFPGNDFDESWGQTSFVKSTIDGEKTVLDVNLGANEFLKKIRVSLKKEGGVWKIDDVADLE